MQCLPVRNTVRVSFTPASLRLHALMMPGTHSSSSTLHPTGCTFENISCINHTAALTEDRKWWSLQIYSGWSHVHFMAVWMRKRFYSKSGTHWFGTGTIDYELGPIKFGFCGSQNPSLKFVNETLAVFTIVTKCAVFTHEKVCSVYLWQNMQCLHVTNMQCLHMTKHAVFTCDNNAVFTCDKTCSVYLWQNMQWLPVTNHAVFTCDKVCSVYLW